DRCRCISSFEERYPEIISNGGGIDWTEAEGHTVVCPGFVEFAFCRQFNAQVGRSHIVSWVQFKGSAVKGYCLINVACFVQVEPKIIARHPAIGVLRQGVTPKCFFVLVNVGLLPCQDRECQQQNARERSWQPGQPSRAKRD